PVAAAVNVAVVPAHAVVFVGFVVIVGAVVVSSAAVVFVDPQPLVNTARYCLLLSANAVVKMYVVDVAPGMFVNVVPSRGTCHCTVLPTPSAAVKVAVLPAHAIRLVGFVVIVGGGLTVSPAVVCAVPA